MTLLTIGFTNLSATKSHFWNMRRRTHVKSIQRSPKKTEPVTVSVWNCCKYFMAFYRNFSIYRVVNRKSTLLSCYIIKKIHQILILKSLTLSHQIFTKRYECINPIIKCLCLKIDKTSFWSADKHKRYFYFIFATQAIY